MSQPNIFDLPLNEITDDQFKEFYDDLMSEKGIKERTVVPGKVIGINNDWITVDVSYKAEGMIPAHEFRTPEGELTIEVGHVVPGGHPFDSQEHADHAADVVYDARHPGS